MTLLISVLLLLAMLSGLGCVDSSGRGGAFSIPSTSIASALLLLPSLVGGLSSMLRSCWFWGPGLRFLTPRVLHGAKKLGGGSNLVLLGRPSAPQASCVHFLSAGGRLQASLRLSLDRLFEYFVPEV